MSKNKEFNIQQIEWKEMNNRQTTQKTPYTYMMI